MEDSSKMSPLTKIIFAAIALFIIWGLLSTGQDNREERIISAAEQACEQRGLKIDCLDFGYDVVHFYKESSIPDPRDSGE